jgi:hypothetical protein
MSGQVSRVPLVDIICVYYGECPERAQPDHSSKFWYLTHKLARTHASLSKHMAERTGVTHGACRMQPSCF